MAMRGSNEMYCVDIALHLKQGARKDIRSRARVMGLPLNPKWINTPGGAAAAEDYRKRVIRALALDDRDLVIAVSFAMSI